jgi:hypothetical protein
MIKNLLALVANDVVRDAETNNISVFNIFEGLQAEGFPVLLQKVCFFTLWERGDDEKEEHDAAFKLSIGSKELQSRTGNLNFQGKKRVRHIIRLQGLILPEPGTLCFSLELGETIAKYAVEVTARTDVSVKPDD